MTLQCNNCFIGFEVPVVRCFVAKTYESENPETARLITVDCWHGGGSSRSELDKFANHISTLTEGYPDRRHRPQGLYNYMIITPLESEGMARCSPTKLGGYTEVWQGEMGAEVSFSEKQITCVCLSHIWKPIVFGQQLVV